MHDKFHYPLPRDEVKSIQQAISKVRFKKTEHLYIFRKSKQIRRYKGEYNQIHIPDEYLFELKDSKVIHNHPNGSTFSFEDVKATVNFDIAELIVVTTQSIYTLIRPKNGWNINFEDGSTSDTLDTCEKQAREMVEKLTAQFQIRNEEKDPIILHYIWVLFFNICNIEYVKKEHQ
ncbi:hypothetical protein [Echinicola sp. 20G]|uniref:hypothetical protein n=1 Tax=Echinicola sp. 20G TaxID=2781961 RepID=UPI001910097B|nr:hypothetical protein [Echinicola sp. 20G]